MSATEDRGRASVGSRWHPRPVPMPPGTARAIRGRKSARRVAAVAVAASFVGLAVAGANVVGSRGEPSTAGVAPPPTWTYDDPSAWPAMVLDPHANANEQLSYPEQANIVNAPSSGPWTGSPSP